MNNTLSTLRIIALAIVLFASVRVDATEANYVNFEIKNHNNIDAPGMIMNAQLDWGKWKVHGIDVNSVSDKEFSNTKRAYFTAMGRSNSPSGTEGRFDIYIDGTLVAKVYFDVPYIGGNTFRINRKVRDYLCDASGIAGSGSPSITITCYKLG